MVFNPNELVLERIRSVEESDPETKEVTGRYTQIEDPSLQTSAEGTDVTDAMGTPIMTFYNAQTGTFSFTNSIFSLDLAASQFGTTKKVASGEDKIIAPVSEVLTIGADHTVVLKYVPVGTTGAEVKYVKVINDDNTFGKTYKVSAVAGEGKFTLDAAEKKITLPDDVTGRVPAVKSLLIHAIFHNPCNKNIVYAGYIYCPRAQIDPSSVELNLTAEGKHAASYILQKPYCDAEAKLFDIIVTQD